MKTDKYKIAFFGSSLISTYWNGAATYYRGLIKALNACGHEITFYEPDAYDRQQYRDIDDPSWAKVVIYPNTRSALKEVVRHACNSDVIIKASAVGAFDQELEKMVLECPKAKSQKVIFWDVNASSTLQRLEDNPEDPFHELIPKYDAIFTYGGGIPVENKYKELGARACHTIYNALDPETHYPEYEDPTLRCDLAFLGNRLPDREERVKEFFIKPAKLLPRNNFVIGGNGWNEDELPGNVSLLGHVPAAMHNMLNCSARVVLNVNSQSIADCGYMPSTRIFEAGGAGACVVTDYWKGIEQFLEPGKEILVAHKGEDVAGIISSLTEKEAYDIGCAARSRIISEHTYKHRARQVAEVLDTMFGKRKPSIVES